MKFLWFFLAIAAIKSASAVLQHFKYNGKDSLLREPKITTPLADFDVVQEGWVRQRLDNFDPQNTDYFYMRYLMNSEHLQEGGPIFIFVGGEWTITPDLIRGGHMYDMARNLSGLMLYSEHRYYGDTHPVPNLELENLQFLTIDQALADLAHFIVYIKESIPAVRNSKVVLNGCSFSGTMVTYFMQKYPHLAVGAWAMSAPVHAKVDFFEYKEVVSHAITKVGGERCANRIQNAYAQMEAMVNARNASRLEKMLQLCEPLDIDNEPDVWNLFHDIGLPWSAIVQYYQEYYETIQYPCEELVSIEADSDAEAYAIWLLRFWAFDEHSCFDHTWKTFVREFSGTTWYSWAAMNIWRQWLYQTCTQIAWFQTSGSENQLFGSKFPIDQGYRMCVDLYGPKFTPALMHESVARTNLIFGGFDSAARHVYSSHGEFDPWAAAGFKEDINEDSPTVILPGAAHCSDILSISEQDTPTMRAHKEKVFETIKRWIEESP